MAVKPKRPAKAPVGRKRAKPATKAAKPAQIAAPAGEAPAFDHCHRCADKSACAFEQRCDGIARNLPVHYTPVIAEIICDRLAAGDMLTNICAEPNMPSPKAVYAWLKRHKEFSDAYLIARKWWADAQLERIIMVAADGSNDVKIDAEGKESVDRDNIARSTLLVRTLQWAMSKMDSAKFGDRITVADDPGPQQTLDEMKAEIRSMLGARKAPEGGGDAATRH